MLDELYQQIDDVAREMTSAPVDASLARRVGARIEQAAATRRSVWTHPALFVPIAAACVLSVAVFVTRSSHVVVTPTPRVASEPAPVVAAPAPSSVEPNVAPATTGASAAAPRETLSARETTPPVIDVAPLRLEVLDVAPIVQAEHIDIDPIAIARIEIAPMP